MSFKPKTRLPHSFFGIHLNITKCHASALGCLPEIEDKIKKTMKSKAGEGDRDGVPSLVKWHRMGCDVKLRARLLKWMRASGVKLFILIIVSFMMLWLGDKLNASGMVLTRFMARVQAPLTAQFSYPVQARDQITVVMYDQEFLQATGSAWPISYQDHADALLRLVADPASRPKAIMLDITFGQERNDPTVSTLRQALCSIHNDYKVPVFLAALPSPIDGRLMVRSGLSANQTKDEKVCFTLVGVDYVPDPLDGIAWTYQMSRHLTDAGWQSGPAVDPNSQPTYRSAAMAIAQDAAHLELGEETLPLALIWGHNSANQAEKPESLAGCRPGQANWKNLVPGVLRQIWEEAPQLPLCPYHQTLSMAQLGVLTEAELAPYLTNKFVFVGAQVPGYNDFADSPVHGLTPGIYMHAMALDNLLIFKSEYKQSAEWTMPPSWNLVKPAFLAIIAVFLVHVVSEFLKGLTFWSKPCLKPYLPGWGTSASFCPRCIQTSQLRRHQAARFLLGSLFWISQITLQTMVALLLIGYLQAHFRIGMLPVAELVAMTLVTEGLEFVEKIEAFFAPSKSE